MSEYRNRRGKPISGLEWQRKFEDVNYRAVSNDLLDNGMQVSTFWVGVADGAPSAARPLFETLVFGGENDHRKRTYATLADAICGHRRIVDKLRGQFDGAADASHAAPDNPSSHSGARSRRKLPRPWVLAMVPKLSECLRSDGRLDVIAGAQLPLESAPAAAGRDALGVDLLIRESSPQGWIPRIAIQCLSGSVTVREVRACNELVARLRQSHPGLRNGIMIRNVTHIPLTVVQHGCHFDFLAVIDPETRIAETQQDLVTVLLDEVLSSCVLSSLIAVHPDRKRCTLIHRPMFLPGNQG